MKEENKSSIEINKCCKNCKNMYTDCISFDNPQCICIKNAIIIEPHFKYCEEYEEKKELKIKNDSYLKLPNIHVNDLQKLIDFCDEYDIKYEEFYEEDLEQQIIKYKNKIESLIKLLEIELKFICENSSAYHYKLAIKLLSILAE